MSKWKEPILHIPESVKKDTLAYRSQVKRFLDGQLSPIAFRAYRVPMGVYEQRAAGKYMVRIRIGAGLVLPYQLEKIAELSKIYGNGIVHITTRQDIQIHEVDIEDTPSVLEGLLEVGLSPRGGGGNTVRNITACPRAGVCPKEKFDVAPYAIAAAEYLLQFKSSYNLPRKYKIVFSGCSTDCAFASVADLGFFAHNKDRVKGFAVYAGGGLGPNPSIGIKIEDFILDNQIFEVAEAVKRMFDKHGNRTNKHQARLRYVLRTVGTEEFIKLYNSEKTGLQKEGLQGDIPKIRDIASRFDSSDLIPEGDKQLSLPDNVLPEKKEGLFTVRVPLRLGDIPADDLVRIGHIADKYAHGLVRTTQLQNILITSVPGCNINGVLESLKEISGVPQTQKNAFGGPSIDMRKDYPKIVACTGAATCKLGLCLSRNLAKAIFEKFHKNKIFTDGNDCLIRISGCPNSCSNHYIADIGFQGRAKRINGRLMPCYEVLVGAKITEGDAHLAEKIGTVPAKRIPDLLVEVFTNSNIEIEQLKSLVAKYGAICVESLPDDYYYDFGATEPFSLAGRGPGECGAGVMDVIKIDIDEAKQAIKAAEKTNENLYKAIVAAARALLIIFGLEPKKDREIFAAFSKHLIEPGWVKPQTQQLLENIIDWRMGNRQSISDLVPQAKDLIKRIEELFLSLDANLKFKVKPLIHKTTTSQAENITHTIDLRGVACPLNFVKAKLELEKIAVGDILEVLLDDGEPIRNAPASFAKHGQEIVEIKNMGNHFCVRVRRKK